MAVLAAYFMMIGQAANSVYPPVEPFPDFIGIEADTAEHVSAVAQAIMNAFHEAETGAAAGLEPFQEPQQGEASGGGA